MTYHGFTSWFWLVAAVALLVSAFANSSDSDCAWSLAALAMSDCHSLYRRLDKAGIK